MENEKKIDWEERRYELFKMFLDAHLMECGGDVADMDVISFIDKADKCVGLLYKNTDPISL